MEKVVFETRCVLIDDLLLVAVPNILMQKGFVLLQLLDLSITESDVVKLTFRYGRGSISTTRLKRTNKNRRLVRARARSLRVR